MTKYARIPLIGGRTELDADELDELITKCIGP